MQCPDCLRPKGNPHEWWCPGRKKEEAVEGYGIVQSFRCPECLEYKGNRHLSYCLYRRSG